MTRTLETLLPGSCVLRDTFVDTGIDEGLRHIVVEHDACGAFEGKGSGSPAQEDETLSENAGIRWRGIMNKKQTYTLYLPEDWIDKDDTVIARGLSATEAMKIVFGYEGGWKTSVHETDYGTFTHYMLTAFPDKRRADRAFNERLHATVVGSGDTDRDKAMLGRSTSTTMVRISSSLIFSPASLR
jgi:hypothetical protein